MKLTFVGCGDAFGSGGRFNTCFHLERAAGGNVLIDCGASSMVAIRQAGVDPNGVAAILVTHLHGDHFGGLPFFILDAQLVSRRTAPLVIAGPPGLGDRLTALMEAMFAGSSRVERRFAVEIRELAPRERAAVAGLHVTPYGMTHPSGAPSYALRVEAEGKVVTYTGDTEWTEELVPAGRDADLFICEAYFHDRMTKFHLDYATVARHLPEIAPKRTILTHMSPEMLARAATLPVETAHDGLVVEF